MNAKNINLFSRQEFFDKVLRKSGSYNSLSVAKTAINNLDRFSMQTFEKNTDVLLSEIRQILQENPNDVTPMIFLDKFSSYLQGKKKSSSCIKGYVNFAKKYLRQCGGLKISGEDMQDYVTIPINEDSEEELEPLIHDELRQILDNIPNQRRKAFYMVLKDTGCRVSEGLQLKKKYFDLTRTPATAYFPKKVTKGKKRKRIQRLTNETVRTLKPILEKLKDDDYLSQSNYGGTDHGYKTERDAFVRIIEKIGLTEKYSHNGRYKKNIHSIRSFCYTQSKLATGDADYAHGYTGHDRYLAVYERLEEKNKDELFNRCAPRLSIFEDVVTISDDDLKKQIEDLRKKVEFLSKSTVFMSSNKNIQMNIPNIEN